MKKTSKDNFDLTEIEKEKSHFVVKIIEYAPKTVLSKTIIKKATGNVTMMSLDTGEQLAEKISPFDTFVQVIDGTAEVTINKQTHLLTLGTGIVIPAHASHHFNAKEQFKMISTVIKSGYEE